LSAPFFVPVVARGGTLAHALFVKDRDVFGRVREPATCCRTASAAALVEGVFDPDLPEHGGLRTCAACAHAVRDALATLGYLGKWEVLSDE
jgi:hypothetical protein